MNRLKLDDVETDNPKAIHRKGRYKLTHSIQRKFIWYNKPMLYIQLKKVLYGTIQAALLFGILLSETLEEWSFTFNPYNRCITNKNINGKQCTIIWHIDDMMTY